MKLIYLQWVILSLVLSAPSAQAIDLDGYAELLDQHTYAVDDTAMRRIDYEALRRSADWERLIRSLETTRLDQLTTQRDELAFWINAYNILAIDLVRRSAPVESIRDLGSFFRPVWDREAGTIDGRSYSLGEIEHEILRPLGDPRIHAAIVCASTSCPSLRAEPYHASRLDEQLDEAVRTFLASSSKGLRVDQQRNTVRLSRIFDWFEEDFEPRGGVIDFVQHYAPEPSRQWLAGRRDVLHLEYFEYDWRLNGLK